MIANLVQAQPTLQIGGGGEALSHSDLQKQEGFYND